MLQEIIAINDQIVIMSTFSLNVIINACTPTEDQ